MRPDNAPPTPTTHRARGAPRTAPTSKETSRTASRPEVPQARGIRMKEDAVNATVGDAEQDRRKWRVLVVENERRLSIELVYFGIQV
jgi:hypothetical protein